MLCPICKSTNTETFVKRQNVPVHQNLICHDKKSAVELKRGNLSMTACDKCGFVFNKDFDNSLLSYGENYDNTQTCSNVFKQYISEQISYLINNKNVNNCNIIEVGCGKGYFLKKIIEEGKGNIGIGFDPSYIGELEYPDGRLRFERRFYDKSCADIKADVVICRHVIEHIQDPISLLRSIHDALSQSPDARVYFETPCVDWILKNNVIWDIFYEHCSLFTKSSLTSAFQIAGFDVIDVRHVFGAQYLWLEAKPLKTEQKIIFNTENIIKNAREYGKNEDALKKDWYQKIEQLKENGSIAVWGAGAKGVTFLNLVDPNNKNIDCVIDLNPCKQGKFIPGTGHEIIAPEQIKTKKIKSIILMNPNYKKENQCIVKDMGLTIKWL